MIPLTIAENAKTITIAAKFVIGVLKEKRATPVIKIPMINELQSNFFS
jgi:hypothetical protein